MKGDDIGPPDDGYETYPMEDISHNGSGGSMKGMEQFKDDIYSFVDEMPNVDYATAVAVVNNNGVPTPPHVPKKRGRKRKQDVENRYALRFHINNNNKYKQIVIGWLLRMTCIP